MLSRSFLKIWYICDLLLYAIASRNLVNRTFFLCSLSNDSCVIPCFITDFAPQNFLMTATCSESRIKMRITFFLLELMLFRLLPLLLAFLISSTCQRHGKVWKSVLNQVYSCRYWFWERRVCFCLSHRIISMNDPQNIALSGSNCYIAVKIWRYILELQIYLLFQRSSFFSKTLSDGTVGINFSSY